MGVVHATLAQASQRVWVNRSSHVYHCPGSRYYGTTKRGEYMSESAARSAGNRPAYGRTCGPTTVAVTPPLTLRGTPSDSAASHRVWVNTSSGVYHCPGTQYYGATKRGEYMNEMAARAAGHRAAGGVACR
jgi:hypothetical protein